MLREVKENMDKKLDQIEKFTRRFSIGYQWAEERLSELKK